MAYVFVFLLATCGVGHAAIPAGPILTYQLQPGSTITPGNIISTTGPTEELTGTFQIRAVDFWPAYNQVIFETISLEFSSSSYTLSYRSGTQGGFTTQATTSWTSTSTTVDTTGLPYSIGQFISPPAQVGSYYVGDPYAPSQFFMPDYHLFPPPSGPSYVLIDLNATLVPEPTSAALIALGLLLTYVTRKR